MDNRSCAVVLDPHIIRERRADDVFEKLIQNPAPHIVSGTELKKIPPDESGSEDGVSDHIVYSAVFHPHPGAAVHQKTVFHHIVGTAPDHVDLVTAPPHVKIGKSEP